MKNSSVLLDGDFGEKPEQRTTTHNFEATSDIANICKSYSFLDK